MHRAKVTSSSIASIGYDPVSQILEVEFLSRAVYQYDQVTPIQHYDFMSADSKGAHFNLHIRDRHPYRQL